MLVKCHGNILNVMEGSVVDSSSALSILKLTSISVRIQTEFIFIQEIYFWPFISDSCNSYVASLNRLLYSMYLIVLHVSSSDNSSTSQSLCALIGGMVRQSSHSGPTDGAHYTTVVYDSFF